MVKKIRNFRPHIAQTSDGCTNYEWNGKDDDWRFGIAICKSIFESSWWFVSKFGPQGYGGLFWNWHFFWLEDWEAQDFYRGKS